MELPDPDTVPRREYLRGLVAVGGAAALAACLDSVDEGGVPTGDPDERPPSQHAWNDVLDTDEYGNIRSPEHRVLLALDLEGEPDQSDREQVEAAFRSLERAYAHDPEGLLFNVGYAPSYFETVGVEPPIPHPKPITNSENPALDGFDTLVHLASDNPEVVLEAEEALLGEVSEPNGVEMSATLAGVFERGQPRRTGFVGAGLPAQHTEMDAVPESIPEAAPFFMGFKSGFANSQAPERRVTIQDGPYAGGTTTQIESLDLQLRSWFEQDDHFLRVAQLFSPAHAERGMVPGVGDELGNSTDIEQFVDRTAADASEGVVGHAQKAARARDEDGTPPLLRRDFNTVDGDFPGIHFLSHQRTIEDFVRVREAMAGEDLDSGVGQSHNNGILQYIFTNRRGNFLVPPRTKRSLPGL